MLIKVTLSRQRHCRATVEVVLHDDALYKSTYFTLLYFVQCGRRLHKVNVAWNNSTAFDESFRAVGQRVPDVFSSFVKHSQLSFLLDQRIS